MSQRVAETVLQAILPYAENLGLEIVEVEYKRKHNGMNLTVYIDKTGGVSIEDCAALHRTIDRPLDDLNPTNDAPYTLNVSSCGLDRPFKTERDYLRNIGKQIEIKLYLAIDGKKSIEGELYGFSGDNIYIKDGMGNSIEVPVSAAAKVIQKIIF